MARRAKRILIQGDMHCGHVVGLTPPAWQIRIDDSAEDTIWTHRRRKWQAVEQEIWRWRERRLSAIRPIDLTIDLADMIDGTGRRSGGTEQLTVDRNQQVEMAVDCLRRTKSRNYCLCRGTAYHTGEAEDWEDLVAGQLEAYSDIDRVEIGAHQWPEVNGVVLDCKHHIGGGQTPSRNDKQLRDERLWNVLWAEHREQPRAQILVRGHGHYYQHSDEVIAGKQIHLARIPALQGMGSKYGSTRCRGHVQVGFCWIDITPTGGIEWHVEIAELQSQAAHTSKF